LIEVFVQEFEYFLLFLVDVLEFQYVLKIDVDVKNSENSVANQDQEF
jgi:hypothetical protein